MVKISTFLVSTISNSQVFLLKNVSSFCRCKSYSHFSAKNIRVYAIFNDQSINDTLTNGIISLEQLGPDCQTPYIMLSLLSSTYLFSHFIADALIRLTRNVRTRFLR